MSLSKEPPQRHQHHVPYSPLYSNAISRAHSALSTSVRIIQRPQSEHLTSLDRSTKARASRTLSMALFTALSSCLTNRYLCHCCPKVPISRRPPTRYSHRAYAQRPLSPYKPHLLNPLGIAALLSAYTFSIPAQIRQSPQLLSKVSGSKPQTSCTVVSQDG